MVNNLEALVFSYKRPSALNDSNTLVLMLDFDRFHFVAPGCCCAVNVIDHTPPNSPVNTNITTNFIDATFSASYNPITNFSRTSKMVTMHFDNLVPVVLWFKVTDDFGTEHNILDDGKFTTLTSLNMFFVEYEDEHGL